MNKLYNYKATVTRVVDGDTVDVLIDLGFGIHYAQRVRLYGINAPETRTRDKVEKKAGLAAKAYLKEILKTNKNKCIIITTLDKKGKYGRVLGELLIPHPTARVRVDEYNKKYPKGQPKKPRPQEPSTISINEWLIYKGHATKYEERA